ISDSGQFDKVEEEMSEFTSMIKSNVIQMMDAGVFKKIPADDMFFIYAYALSMRFIQPHLNELTSQSKIDDEELIKSHIDSMLKLFAP
ncbi:MAG: hypothetical protein HKN16_06705, partial [Saprospiraceae bacterium]|nr:hypothetical protein [Saprospiraceae bacterium]